MSDNLKKSDNKKPLILLLSAFVLLGFYFIAQRYYGDIEEIRDEKRAEPPQSYNTEQRRYTENETSNDKTSQSNLDTSQYIKINPLQEYNYLSKDEIYSIRKNYVKKSLFWTPLYEPSNEIFGQIQSGKPWWGLQHTICISGEDNTTGISAMSRFINNPNLLVTFMSVYIFKHKPETEEFCNSKFANFMPYKAYFDAKNKIITARYKMGRFIIDNLQGYSDGEHPHYLMLVGMNAKDFGYRYVKIQKLVNIGMRTSPNAAENIHEFQDYIHVGGSCGAEGGCNNISPRQSELEFQIKDLPAEISMELYKHHPNRNIPVYPDFRYKIIFEEY